ncbi:Serine/threonine protein kinase [Handroanthus impetiginosus]|uniref:non-specific serine/threonine protein kinase n=1 Tax=Handroanthus impetiginosus TaxID=429701 RepID=A0A2G9I6W2_9LAMI|nr:Serine/threonine protein kinase [Handroanthus impetiginosus]
MGFLLSKRASYSENLVKRIILASVYATLVLTSVAQFLPEDEVQVLRTISSKLNISYWNPSPNACISGFNKTVWEDEKEKKIYSGVACNCSFDDNTVCHVTNIQLKGLNLTGTLPVEFTNLSHLREIDLSRNYLNGSIPTIFGQLHVVNLSLLGNLISGTIPKELGDIATLENLVLEDNLLEGNIPSSLGSLSNLKKLHLSANNLNGTIPGELANLKNLTDFRIDGNTMSGRIPDFIGNWTKLDRLDMQGTSLEGPIPATISELKNLTSLRITDLRGPSMRFPNLQNMTGMKELILRNCSINDSIPPYLGDMNGLKALDLSFNMLNGEIPSRLQRPNEIDFLFLSHNSLTGEVPDWILGSGDKMDLSYNNFTGSSSGAGSCQSSNVNLVASHSTLSSNSNPWCLKPDLPCPGKANHHSLFINCGGRRIGFEGNDYEENSSNEGASRFESHDDRWAYSSTGKYMGNEKGRYTAANDTPMIFTGAEFYQTARVSPSSLKYYGLCLRRGSYRVRLHFAEIMYSDNATFSSLGRRIFDVAIQGKVVLADFDIVKEAKGVRRGIPKDFDVDVNGSTLEIHLYWTGKGTTAIPDRGVYGPLISAIAVTPNFDVSTGLSVGAIVGIVISSCGLLLLVSVLLWRYLRRKAVEDDELRGLDLQTGYFTLRQIKAATNSFDSANKIGEGGFGPVYKGVLHDGTVIAVKQLSSKSKQGNREFVNEIGMISALQHPNLVKLYGCCIEGNQLLLIYEYLENNCLARALFGDDEQRLNIDWKTRKKICLGIARGLAYLHEESRLKIVHRDIKATNVLLDKDLNAKISDFGLAKLDEEENTHISTRIAGTVGYMAPEYAMRGYLTDKADVYSFGIVALEIVSGKSNTNYRPKEEFVYLLHWAYVLQEQGNLLELVDPLLGSNYSEEEALRMLNLALLCANPSLTLRPSMSSVVSMLEGKIPVQAPIVKRGTMNDNMRFKALEMISQDSQTRVSTLSQDSREQRGVLMDGTWIDSSVSLSSRDDTQDQSSSSRLLPDLYDVNLS